VRPAAVSKNLAFSVRLPADLPPLRVDRDRLAQVLINLLDNAVKFTPEHGRVDLSAAASDGWVTIEISDTGIGIPPEDLPRIFERFYRVDRSRDRREGGTGLGLAIAKHLTLGMGGTIDVQSVSGSGTTFRLTFPVA
jgi:two-component system phosphate regulon sensor histidine kinase PhoR